MSEKERRNKWNKRKLAGFIDQLLRCVFFIFKNLEIFCEVDISVHFRKCLQNYTKKKKKAEKFLDEITKIVKYSLFNQVMQTLIYRMANIYFSDRSLYFYHIKNYHQIMLLANIKLM